MSKTGLVIQGPLTSSGMAGNGQQVEFNCLENIEKIVNNFGDLFAEIVVSTWDTESPKHLSRLESLGVIVVTSKDPRTIGFQGFWSDNRDRQFVSSSSGIAYLRDKVDFVCKVRTDQYFDLSLFLGDFFNIQASFKDYETVGLKSFLHGLFIESTRPYSMCDYAYTAHISVLAAFYEAQELYKAVPFTEDTDFPEGDSIRKFLYFVLNGTTSLDPISLLPAIPKDLSYLQMPFGKLTAPLETLISWQSALTCCLSVSESEVVRNLIWRGKPFSESLQESEIMTYQQWRVARFSYISFLISMNKHLVDISIKSKWFLFERNSSSPRSIAFKRGSRRVYRFTMKLWTKLRIFR